MRSLIRSVFIIHTIYMLICTISRFKHYITPFLALLPHVPQVIETHARCRLPSFKGKATIHLLCDHIMLEPLLLPTPLSEQKLMHVIQHKQIGCITDALEHDV